MAGVLGVSMQGLDDLASRINSLPARLDGAEQTAVRMGSMEALRLFRQKVTGPVLKRRSGHYAQSTNASAPEKDVAGWKAEVGVKKGPAERYAEIHETGGTVKPKKGKYLTIPVGEALTSAGVPRYSGPLDPALDSRDVFWIFPKGKNPRVVESDENDELTTLFIAVKEVTIPARRPLALTLEEMRPRMHDLTTGILAKALGSV